MKFLVINYLLLDESKPCSEAVEMMATPLDCRAVSTIEEAKKEHWFEEWYNSTINHKEIDNMVVGECKYKRKVWYVEINSLEDLLKFINKYNCVIVDKSFAYKELKYEIIFNYVF